MNITQIESHRFCQLSIQFRFVSVTPSCRVKLQVCADFAITVRLFNTLPLGTIQLQPRSDRMVIPSMPWERHHIHYRTLRNVQGLALEEEAAAEAQQALAEENALQNIDFDVVDALVEENLLGRPAAVDVVVDVDVNAVQEPEAAAAAAAVVQAADNMDPIDADAVNSEDSESVPNEVMAVLEAASDMNSVGDNSDAFSLVMATYQQHLFDEL